MPRTKRTPPGIPAMENQRASTNPNSTATTSETEIVNVSQRTKRPRSECSPSNELKDFKEEMRNMLAKWHQEQESSLKQFMTKITLELGELKVQSENLKKIKIDIEEAASLMNEKYEEIKTKFLVLENERIEQRKYISQLEKQLLDIQDTRRTASLELRNVPLKDGENSNDLVKVITDTGKCLQVQIDPAEIRDVYRPPSKQGPSNQIIVEFQTVIKKNHILKVSREFNKGKPNSKKLNSELIGLPGESVPIYISDRLSSTTRQLFYEARKFAATNDFKFCWTSNGKIFLRKKEGEKPVRIFSEKCLRNI